MFSRLKNITDKVRNVAKIGLVVMALVKALTTFADEIDKIAGTPKTEENE